MTTKLIDREYYSDGFTGCGRCKWHFKACDKNFVVEWCDKMFDTPEPEAKAYWGDDDGYIVDWNELAASNNPNPKEACIECLTEMYKKNLISSLVFGEL